MTDVSSIYFAPVPDNFFADDRMISLCWIRIISFLFVPEMDDFCYKGHPIRRNMAIRGGRVSLKKSNLLEIQRIETATYNKEYFAGEYFLYFKNLSRGLNLPKPGLN